MNTSQSSVSCNKFGTLAVAELSCWLMLARLVLLSPSGWTTSSITSGLVSCFMHPLEFCQVCLYIGCVKNYSMASWYPCAQTLFGEKINSFLPILCFIDYLCQFSDYLHVQILWEKTWNTRFKYPGSLLFLMQRNGQQVKFIKAHTVPGKEPFMDISGTIAKHSNYVYDYFLLESRHCLCLCVCLCHCQHVPRCCQHYKLSQNTYMIN